MTLLLCALLAASGIGVPQEHAPTPQTAEIRGHVIGADGRPAARAQVRLSARQVPGGRSAQTDESGGFEITGLPPGTYMLIVSKHGFLPAIYSDQYPNRPLTLHIGEIRERVDLRLWHTSAIVGHVADEDGDPVDGINVAAFRVAFSDGRRQLIRSGSGSAKTNDQGRFRVYGLPPGRYLIAADISQVGVSDMPNYASTYFPGTPNPGEAQPIALGRSQEVADIDFRLSLVRTVRVSGTTATSTGEPFQGGIEMRVSRRSSMVALDGFGARTGPGTFEFPHVAPGEYVICAFKNAETGCQFVVVGDADVTGLAIQTLTGSTIDGRVVYEGADPPRRGVEVNLWPADPDLFPFKGQDPQADMRDDGTFQIRLANGLARFRTQAPRGWAVKAVTLNGDDVTDKLFLFGTKDQSLKNVEVTLTDRLTDVAGIASDASGRPAADYSVVIFSPDHDRWYSGSRFMTNVPSTSEGTFDVPGLPPGNYCIVAVDWFTTEDQLGNWRDPEMLDRLAKSAQRISLTEGQKLSVSLKLTPK